MYATEINKNSSHFYITFGDQLSLIEAVALFIGELKINSGLEAAIAIPDTLGYYHHNVEKNKWRENVSGFWETGYMLVVDGRPFCDIFTLMGHDNKQIYQIAPVPNVTNVENLTILKNLNDYLRKKYKIQELENPHRLDDNLKPRDVYSI